MNLKVILGIILLLCYTRGLWVAFVDQPEWMRSWNKKSKLFLVLMPLFFFVGLGLVFTVKR